MNELLPPGVLSILSDDRLAREEFFGPVTMLEHFTNKKTILINMA